MLPGNFICNKIYMMDPVCNNTYHLLWSLLLTNKCLLNFYVSRVWVIFPSKFDANRLRLCFAFELDNVSTIRGGEWKDIDVSQYTGKIQLCHKSINYHSNYTLRGSLTHACRHWHKFLEWILTYPLQFFRDGYPLPNLMLTFTTLLCFWTWWARVTCFSNRNWGLVNMLF